MNKFIELSNYPFEVNNKTIIVTIKLIAHMPIPTLGQIYLYRIPHFITIYDMGSLAQQKYHGKSIYIIR